MTNPQDDLKERRAKIEARIAAHLGRPLSDAHLAFNDRQFAALASDAAAADAVTVVTTEASSGVDLAALKNPSTATTRRTRSGQ